MFARAGLFCVLLSALAGVAGAAEDGRLLLGDKTVQSAAEVDFARLPVWRSLFKCGERLTTDSCRLQRMTENPTGTAREEIIGTALRLAVQIDRARTDSTDGFASLRASQAYLVAAAFEAETNRADVARAHFQLALDRAGEVPQKIAHFDSVYNTATAATTSVRGSMEPSLGGANSRVVSGIRATEEPVKYYGVAQLVREFAAHALAALEAGMPLFGSSTETPPPPRFSR